MKKKNKVIKILIASILLGGMYLYINKDVFIKEESKYSKEALEYAEVLNIKDEINEQDYDELINDLLEEKTFEKDKWLEYENIVYQKEEGFLDSMNILLNKGYKAEEINLIYSSLANDEINDLSNQNYLENLEDYLNQPHFITSFINRYIEYKKDNDIETTITYVNADLDREFYDADTIKVIENPDDTLVLLNKFNKIDENYSPALVTISKSYSTRTLQVKNEVKIAFEKMCDEAKKEGLEILAASTYRTYSYQEGLYNNYAAKDGYDAADTYSARPGHSEHHTGLAIDVTTEDIGFGINSSFKETEEYPWIKDNAHKYGFIIRYPEGKEHITGYMAESWHLRFVDVEVATYIYENDITFDEYYAKFLLKK